MSEQTIITKTPCPANADGKHRVGRPVRNEQVHASVITCDCGEQWIVDTDEHKARYT